MSETWTQDDELQLAAMLHRKTEVVNKRRTVLKALVSKLDLDIDNGTIEIEPFVTPDSLADQLIKHADEITTALKPFTRKEVGHAVKFDLPKLEASDGQN